MGYQILFLSHANVCDKTLPTASTVACMRFSHSELALWAHHVEVANIKIIHCAASHLLWDHQHSSRFARVHTVRS
jgi:hypothetical protein